jgi:twitching motility protein PilT
MDISELLAFVVKNKASDLHLSSGLPPMIRVNGDVRRINLPPMEHKDVHAMVYDIMNDAQRKHYEESLECDFSFAIRNLARFRVNAFVQNRGAGAVMRTIPSKVLSLEDLKAPMIFKEISDQPRGIVLVTGPTGSGKSTTLAAMIDYRNSNRSGHILTIEDPIEYLFEHKQSLINQREIGVDTQSYHMALQNALREAPDLIMVGEIRDKETMQAALIHTLTGHLCLSTIHANNSYHALSRIINLFPYEARSAVLSDLSIGLRAIICQRLIRNSEGVLQPAVEILLNTALIAELIKNGEFPQIKEAMEQSLYPGSQTFEQALCRLYLDGAISYDEAMAGSDSPTNLAWLINQNSPSARIDAMQEDQQGNTRHRMAADFESMTIVPEMLEERP